MFLFTVVPAPSLSTFSHTSLQGIYLIREEQSSCAIDLFTRHLLDILKNGKISLAYWSFCSYDGDDSSVHRTFKICTKNGKKAAYDVTCARVYEPAGETVEKIGSRFYSWKSVDTEKTEPEPKPFRCMVSTNNTIGSCRTYAVDLDDLLSKIKKSYDPLEAYTWHVRNSVVPVFYATYGGALEYSIIVEEM